MPVVTEPVTLFNHFSKNRFNCAPFLWYFLNFIAFSFLFCNVFFLPLIEALISFVLNAFYNALLSNFLTLL